MTSKIGNRLLFYTNLKTAFEPPRQLAKSMMHLAQVPLMNAQFNGGLPNSVAEMKACKMRSTEVDQ